MKAAVVFACLVVTTVAIRAADLYSQSVQNRPAENGKLLTMTVREIERTDEASLMAVELVSGGSVSSAVYIVKGMCGIMKARGEHNVVSEELKHGPARYRLTFPATVDIKGFKGFTEGQCDLFGAP